MTYQQPGAYAGMPAYPGGPGLPPKPPLPGSVLRAFQCMLGGAVLSVLSAVAVFPELGTIRSALEKGLPHDDHDMIDSLVTATIVVTVVTALIEAGLWVWMAFAAKAGNNYARIVGTVFFGLDAAATLFSTPGFFVSTNSGSTSSTFASSDTMLGQIVNWLIFVIGLAAALLMWRKSSSEYFRPEQFHPAPPYGYPGHGYPGYGHPGYGYPGYPPNAAPNMQGAPPQAPQGSQSGPQSGPPRQG
jgi:hypothetical protein